ncbi:MAG TPA: LPS assembly lipoprotein LptE [Thermohalobaculum sp.]|nr:LPS assembly lipoprotein LptE [Thermohalobaculum sp.]
MSLFERSSGEIPSESGVWPSPGRRLVLARLGGMLLIGGVLAVPLGGCFRPMLAEDSASSAMIGRIGLPKFDDRFGYYLNDSLRDRLGRPRSEDFRLEVRTQIDRSNLAIAQDNAVTRISLTATADWALYPAGGSEPLLADQSISQSGYNSTASLFATRAAKQDIERRLARDLGERIARSLLARSGEIAKGNSAGTAAAAGS